VVVEVKREAADFFVPLSLFWFSEYIFHKSGLSMMLAVG